MVKYSCERCGKEFSQKSHYNSHKKRKTLCENNADKIKQLVDKSVEEKMKKLYNANLIVEKQENTEKKMTINYDKLYDNIVKNIKIDTHDLYNNLCKVNRIEHSNGVYYTPSSFFKDVLIKIEIEPINDSLSILDFCCGTGNLFITFLDHLKNKIPDKMIKNIIIKSTFVDIDKTAIKIFKLKLYCWIKNNLSLDIGLQKYDNNFKIFDALLDINNITTKFDIIISNPPFINLKSKTEYKKKIKALKYYEYTTNGMMDTFLLSIERIIKFLKTDGKAIIICPTQLLTNITNKKLRQFILNNVSINTIMSFNENNKIFQNITQNICILDITNNLMNENINYMDCDYNDKIVVKTNNYIKKNIYSLIDYTIIYLSEQDITFITHLNNFKNFKYYKNDFVCKRGNIDISLDKKHIIKTKTDYPLIRGRNIHSLDIDEYIDIDIIEMKGINIKDEKLVCQQISNNSSKNRLNFKLVNKNYIISNSCNYILANNSKHVTYLKHILNSKILNKYFDILSGNNHISIQEINNLPMFDLTLINEDIDNYTDEQRELYICKLYNFNDDFIMNYLNLSKEHNIIETMLIRNHNYMNMSDLEMSMAIHVKPGGNWTNIPLKINTSKRLNKIRETKGRTTLYGRLDYNKPAYTITTQFSRFPNSSNLHPSKNRMITIREAAIIQSFPLDFIFNSKNSVAITQIGNAVPPLLARFIANYIKDDIQNKNTLDLFSGVGGMALGFKQEGFNIILSNELNPNIANENKEYNPETMFVCGDITDVKIQTEINKKLDGIAIGVIIGGPPCQGFSLAGKRAKDDCRNNLYLKYFDMITKYNPECFVMENVKGILSMKNEKKLLVIDNIRKLAKKLGYNISIFKLNAIDFAVPQKRERVFIIGHKTKTYKQPNSVIDKEKHVTTKDAINFLENFPENELINIPKDNLNNDYIKYLNNDITLEELYESYS